MVLKVAVSPDLIGGDVDAGYGKVADAFRANFAQRREVGAAVAVYRDGVKVVDLWGGYRNGRTTEPWQHDTMVNMFSTTKGVASLAVAVAAARGLIDYDAAVADYWPEFAQAGKANVTVRQLLSHQAGLPALDAPLRLADLADPAKLSAVLAAQAPAWPPGTRHGYHALTLGWYESELIRRTDPAGRTLGRYFADEIAAPLGLQLYIGLPAAVDRTRVAQLHGWKRVEALLHLNTMPPRLALALLNPFGLTGRSVNLPNDIDAMRDFNREDVRTVEMPAANGIGTARSVAAAYGSAATGGGELGLTPTTFDALTQPAVAPSRGLRDKVLHVDSVFSLGYCKPVPHFCFGSSDKAFGTPGLGGSLGFADPDSGIGFGYVMNRLGFHLYSDPREIALRQALFRDVLGARPQT
ncbi:serine hydrolase domain-containing protein [Mycobacterium talmoniae]|uniref:Beta-lactamase n=1 Tax=Mycobacterium talmoniae TaxID=1858794 RepID=A0A1S1NIZ1_9MYCO|nr:serine hydrolase domain-containing protein [Mycobacterium talmoniae]OHV01735.1 EstA family serine hydrolase [Mycobacterium talmoniae]PQM46557.1 Beta-lactamase [Mycobacterium talmoniae]